MGGWRAVAVMAGCGRRQRPPLWRWQLPRAWSSVGTRADVARRLLAVVWWCAAAYARRHRRRAAQVARSPRSASNLAAGWRLSPLPGRREPPRPPSAATLLRAGGRLSSPCAAARPSGRLAGMTGHSPPAARCLCGHRPLPSLRCRRTCHCRPARHRPSSTAPGCCCPLPSDYCLPPLRRPAAACLLAAHRLQFSTRCAFGPRNLPGLACLPACLARVCPPVRVVAVGRRLASRIGRPCGLR
jgi:hypothetical protein